MDFIPFERVTISEAKATLDVPRKPVVQRNWTPQRNPIAAALHGINNEATEWMRQLPAQVRPVELGRQFPRIANRLAELWRRPLYCEDYLDALMLDTRGDRQGFPQSVAKELAALKIHLITHVMDQHFDVWGRRIGIESGKHKERD